MFSFWLLFIFDILASKTATIPRDMIGKIDLYVQDIYSSLPDNALFMLFGNRSHYIVKECVICIEINSFSRFRWENEKNNTVWTDELQLELEKKIAFEREHMAFIRLKNNLKTIEMVPTVATNASRENTKQKRKIDSEVIIMSANSGETNKKRKLENNSDGTIL
jgi:hypothetical protein